jgi:fused signal recognition particle receptor
MAELEKISRVMKKLKPEAPDEVFLVLDATTGQNAIQQAKEFTKVAPVTGLILTKLDGTAKGGVVIAIANEFKIPVRYIGVGEKIGDLQEFDPAEFVNALFETEESHSNADAAAQ